MLDLLQRRHCIVPRAAVTSCVVVLLLTWAYHQVQLELVVAVRHLDCKMHAAEYSELFVEATKRLQQQGGQQVEIDFSPFAATAKLLYESAFVAERYSGIRGFLDDGKVWAPDY